MRPKRSQVRLMLAKAKPIRRALATVALAGLIVGLPAAAALLPSGPQLGLTRANASGPVAVEPLNVPVDNVPAPVAVEAGGTGRSSADTSYPVPTTRDAQARLLREAMETMRRQDFARAEAMLRAGAASGDVHAKFYLAWLLADRRNPGRDPGEAFRRFEAFATDYQQIDPFQNEIKRYVAHAAIHTARIYRDGLASAGIRPDAELARDWMFYAANYLRIRDAQFELAQMYLNGVGGGQDTEAAKHWLATLSRQGDAQAQLSLAEQFWQGGQFERRPVWALALSTLALVNSPVADRVYIADRHHSIFCGMSAAARVEAQNLLLDWTDGRGRKFVAVDAGSEALLARQFVRVCQGGEYVGGGLSIDRGTAAHSTGVVGLIQGDGQDDAPDPDAKAPQFAATSTPREITTRSALETPPMAAGAAAVLPRAPQPARQRVAPTRAMARSLMGLAQSNLVRPAVSGAQRAD